MAEEKKIVWSLICLTVITVVCCMIDSGFLML